MHTHAHRHVHPQHAHTSARVHTHTAECLTNAEEQEQRLSQIQKSQHAKANTFIHKHKFAIKPLTDTVNSCLENSLLPYTQHTNVLPQTGKPNLLVSPSSLTGATRAGRLCERPYQENRVEGTFNPCQDRKRLEQEELKENMQNLPSGPFLFTLLWPTVRGSLTGEKKAVLYQSLHAGQRLFLPFRGRPAPTVTPKTRTVG